MAGSYTLPNPLAPATSDPLTSLPIRQNFQSIQSQINNADGAALQPLTVLEGALSLNANPRSRATNAGQTYFVSGLNPVVPGSGLILTIPAGIAYVNGYYVSYAGGTLTVTANKDTYLDIDQNGAITPVTVNNNAAAGALTANSARFAKVVANTNITQVLQNLANTAPVAPSTLNWFGFDSLGNPVYNTNPNNARLGYAQITTAFPTASTTFVDVTGLTATVIVPAGARNLKITIGGTVQNTTAANNSIMAILDGATVLETFFATNPAANGNVAYTLSWPISAATAGSHTYKMQLATSAGTATILAGATPTVGALGPAYFLVEID